MRHWPSMIATAKDTCQLNTGGCNISGVQGVLRHKREAEAHHEEVPYSPFVRNPIRRNCDSLSNAMPVMLRILRKVETLRGNSSSFQLGLNLRCRVRHCMGQGLAREIGGGCTACNPHTSGTPLAPHGRD